MFIQIKKLIFPFATSTIQFLMVWFIFSGAAIIENLHYKQIYDRREYEKNVLESVKAKMERIRASNKNNYRCKLNFKWFTFILFIVSEHNHMVRKFTF